MDWEKLKEKLHKRNRDVKMYLHIGYPKTGTTSTQYFCYINRAKLRSKGLFYPVFDTKYAKHGKFIRYVNLVDEKSMYDYMDFVINKVKPSDKVILMSIEGLSFMYTRFPDGGKEILKKLASFLDCTFLVVLRDPVDFIWSWYKQCLINPPNNKIANEFGGNLSLNQLCELKHINSFLDYPYFINLLKNDLGEQHVSVKGKSNKLLYSFFNDLGFDLTISNFKTIRKNTSTSDSAVAFLSKYNLTLERYKKLRKWLTDNRTDFTSDRRKNRLKKLAIENLNDDIKLVVKGSRDYLIHNNIDTKINSEINIINSTENSNKLYQEELAKTLEEVTFDLIKRGILD